MRDRAKEPWISLTLGDVELLRLPLRGYVTFGGAPGAGKTSAAARLLVEHARDRGPAILLSLEMDAVEIAGRIVGEQCSASWEDALRGRVLPSEEERALALPRLSILDEDATLVDLVAEIHAMRQEYPDEPILVGVDYLQLLAAADAKSEREAIAAVSREWRALAKRERIVGLVIVHGSRQANRSVKEGALGAETTGYAAGTGQIDRDTYAELTLGPLGPQREDGTHAGELSIAKNRMGGGDRVIPLSIEPRTGRFRVVGDARPAAEVRAERKATEKSDRQRAAELAMFAFADRSNKAVTKSELIRAAAIGKGGAGIGDAAVAALKERGELVEVPGRSRSRYPRLWTPGRVAAQAAGGTSDD